MHSPTVAVDQPCASPGEAGQCPWPKQLFLQNDIILTSTKSSSWNMNQHPFDVQVRRWWGDGAEVERWWGGGAEVVGRWR